MKHIVFLAAITMSLFFTSCAGFSEKKSAAEVVYLDDKLQIENGTTLENKSPALPREIITGQKKENGDITTTASDGSQITVMTDNAGNKTESRCFNNHPLIACVVVSTSIQGNKQVLVYGQNGSVKKSLPENMVDNVLTIPANELASAAGIVEGRKQTNFPTIVLQRAKDSQPVQPIPSYKFPVQKEISAGAVTIDENNQTMNSSGEKLNPKTNQKEETPQTAVQNRQPETNQGN